MWIKFLPHKRPAMQKKTPEIFPDREPKEGITPHLLKDISPGVGGDKREASPDKSTEGPKKFHPNVDEGKKLDSQNVKEKSPVVEKKTPDGPPTEKKKTPERPAVDEHKAPAVTPAEDKKIPAVTPADKNTPAIPADDKKSPATPAAPAVDENKEPPKQAAFGLRPNQDNTFDDDHFEVKTYAHETDKDPAGVVIEPKVDGVPTNADTKSVPNKSSWFKCQIM